MERRHYSVNHPAVISHRGRPLTVAERRRAVVARNPRTRLDRVKVQAFVGLLLIVGTGLAFDSAESGGSWLLVGLLGTLAGTFLLNAIRQVEG